MRRPLRPTPLLALGAILLSHLATVPPLPTAAAQTREPTVADQSPGDDPLAAAFESKTVRVSPAKDAPAVEFAYRLLRPAAPKPGVKYPLVLFLHGAGERGTDNLAQLKYLPAWMAEPAAREKFPCYLLAPQCRVDEKWVDISWSDLKSTPQKPTPTVDMLAAIAALEETMKREPVDPRRVYLTGLSMGGYGSWDLAARMPDRFAAVIPICGGADEATAARLEGLPIWCFHGDADQAVPVARSRTIIEAIRKAGGEPRYSELAGVGHDSWTPAYRDPAVLEWLFAQTKPTTTK